MCLCLTRRDDPFITTYTTIFARRLRDICRKSYLYPVRIEKQIRERASCMARLFHEPASGNLRSFPVMVGQPKANIKDLKQLPGNQELAATPIKSGDVQRG